MRSETVLVVEDDEDVLAVVKAMLHGLEYKVISVLTAEDAHEILDRENVDLVLSDVMLPGGVSGPEFAQCVRVKYPDLKIIFMSGYPAGSASGNSHVSTDEVLLGKPFSKQQLATALRNALD